MIDPVEKIAKAIESRIEELEDELEKANDRIVELEQEIKDITS